MYFLKNQQVYYDYNKLNLTTFLTLALREKSLEVISNKSIIKRSQIILKFSFYYFLFVHNVQEN